MCKDRSWRKPGYLRDLHIAHAIPGRMRLKSLRFKNMPPRHAHDMAIQLTAIDGIHKVDTNSTTGSVTVHYKPSALDSVEFLLKMAAALGLTVAEIDPGELEEWLHLFGHSSNGDVDFKSGLESLTDSLNEAMKAVAPGRIDLKMLIPMTLIFLGVRSVFVSDILAAPKWYEYFWFAFGAYFTLNEPNAQKDAAT